METDYRDEREKKVNLQDLAEEEILQALDTRDKFLNLVVNNLPVLLFLIDRTGFLRYSAGSTGQNHSDTFIAPVNSSIYQPDRANPSLIAGFEHASQGKPYTVNLMDRNQVLSTHFSPLKNSSGKLVGVLGIAVDISEQRRVETALADSENRFRVLIDRAAIGVVLKAVDGKMFSFNPYFLNMLGYSAEEMSAWSYIEITHPQDQAISQRYFNELVSGKRERYSLEKRYRKKNGQDCWARVTASLMTSPEGRPDFVIAMVEDITKQRQMVADLEEVRRRLIHAREVERLMLAQQMHEGPLQDILGVAYQLRALEQNLTAGSADIEQNLDLLRSVQNTLFEITSTLRKITGQLRPPNLAPYGLEKAIRSHASQFQSEHPEFLVVVRLAEDRQSLPNEIRIALFRIYQELVNNAALHSGASTIWVRLMLDEDTVVLEVQDDGSGFDLPGRWIELARRGHLGLVGAIERAESVGGRLEIESKINSGTIIRAFVPRNSVQS